MNGVQTSLLLALLTAGCGASSPPSSGATVSISVSDYGTPGTGIFDSTPTTLVGVALPMGVETGDPDSTQTVRILAADPSIATVVASEMPNTFLLIGRARGTTELHVFLDKSPVDTVNVGGSDVTMLTAAVDAQP